MSSQHINEIGISICSEHQRDAARLQQDKIDRQLGFGTIDNLHKTVNQVVYKQSSIMCVYTLHRETSRTTRAELS